MLRDLYYPSSGKGIIHACRWEPEGQIKGVIQIVHGIAEYAMRYDDFASFLNSKGFLVIAEDHMGHGRSGGKGCIKGYFYGGWHCAVEDTYQLLENTRAEFPDVPYILLGHSSGSAMVRTLLISYPKCDLSGTVICGTGWMQEAVLQTTLAIVKTASRMNDHKSIHPSILKILLGGLNRKVEHPRTEFDWLSRDHSQVDAYIDDVMYGFTISSGLVRDLLDGIAFTQKPVNLQRMNMSTPVYFISGGDDPVGEYGSGVRKTANKFRKIGMQRVYYRIFPLCRHEILNEINKQEIYEDILNWIHII